MSQQLAELERAQATLDALAAGTSGRIAVAAVAAAITQESPIVDR